MSANRFIWPVLSLLILVCCDSDTQQRNPYLQEFGFRFEINLGLPTYNPLTTIGNPVYIPTEGAGIRGVFVMNTGFDVYRAFEATCPNHSPNSCSTMTIEGQNAVCACEDFEYSLFTGQQLDRPDDDNRYYDMLEYRASPGGNSIIISN
ncbi:hypothetical protein [Robiginitalea aurantiaca]|mgnify:CR=1 FL=1|uniref:Rieske domain-containing protein n=1 Tax=Robiginitalea aurantiaca TaxID=3056915 RepID=A0ABT7WEL9_9FLAO|nr:hypothetical protein [Robiginitalea aurantiaca]MDM9631348.1 hypothetical protein [Robiginitalea aurantiaca]